MVIYNFSPETYELLNESVAIESPMSPGDYLIPAYATQLEPPTYGVHEIPVFLNGVNDVNLKGLGDMEYVPDAKWVILPDFRNTPYYNEEGIAFKIERLNDKVDYTKFLTPEEFQSKPVSEANFNFSTRQWVINKSKLQLAVMSKVAAIKYDLQEATIISNDIFSSKTAMYNTQLHDAAIKTFESGIPVRWRNLDGTRLDITNENLPKLKSLLSDIRAAYQEFFSAEELVDIEIFAETDTDKLINFDAVRKYEAALVAVKNK